MPVGEPRVGVPRLTIAVVIVGGLLALFGTYWDEAWHTDIGRDSTFSPPHLFLYAGTAAVLAGLGWWGWRAFRASSLRAVLLDRPLRLSLAGGAVAAASAPIDVAWHAAFGRHAVLWSPPHMLGIAGFIAVAAGLLTALHGIDRPRQRLLVAVTAALLLAVCLVPVVEYEGDVPQFAELWYLPVATAGIVLAFAVAERVDTWAWLVTAAAAIYTGGRFLISGTMAATGHSAQLIPPVIVGAVVFDLTRGWRPVRRATALTAAVALSYVPALNLVYRGVRLSATDLIVALPLMFIVAAVVLFFQQPRHERLLARTTAAIVLVGLLFLPASPVLAHDPGQGEVVLPVELDATTTDRKAEITAIVDHHHCDDLHPVRTVARRAGVTVTGPLIQERPCTFDGEIDLPEPSRWFVYVEVEHHGTLLEAWLPVHTPEPAHRPTETTKQDWLYIPAGTEDFSPGQWASGILIYLIILGLFVESLLVSRTSSGTPSP